MSLERVRLEVAILAADEAPSASAPPPHTEAVTILVIATDPDVRRYVHECLRGLANVRVLAVVLVSELPHADATADRRVRFLARPYTPAGLAAEIQHLLQLAPEV